MLKEPQKIQAGVKPFNLIDFRNTKPLNCSHPEFLLEKSSAQRISDTEKLTISQGSPALFGQSADHQQWSVRVDPSFHSWSEFQPLEVQRSSLANTMTCRGSTWEMGTPKANGTY